MSAFLGPVHHWMYGKIQLQETLTDRLLALAQAGVAAELDDRFGPADSGALADIIDGGDIHGWLNARVTRAEERFAAAVTALLQEGVAPQRLAQVAAALGGEHSVHAGTGVSEAYRALDGVLLDGMPCDGGRQIISADNDELVFQYDPALHALCNQGRVGEAAFSALRLALMEGILRGSGLRVAPLGGGSCKLTREG